MQEERTLPPQTFSELLKWLSKDKNSAGDEYEIIRRRLIRFFTIRGCYEADRLADRTIDRVSRKASTVVPDYVGDPVHYFLNVASKIYLEWTREPQRWTEPIRYEPSDVLRPDEGSELACLDKCLAELSDDARSLIVSYYSTERSTHTKERKALAEELGITLSALHIRASRIRTKLYRCVQTCLDTKNRKVS